jgi:nitronate monooxygenase
LAPLGVNVFVLGDGGPADPAPVAAYAATLAEEARIAGVAPGTAHFDDDDWAAKIDLLAEARMPVVSFTFGCPEESVFDRLHAAGSEVWVTVTRPEEADRAAAAGADALVVQGTEAGGHRGAFTDDPADDLSDGIGLLSLLQLIRARTRLPLVAAGGIATGAGIAAALAAGADAAQLGTAFLRCPEAGTAEVQREALASDTPTAVTRAFTGRTARGIRNRFLDAHSAEAPAAYPEVHFLTAPLRRAGRESGNPDLVNLWAGQTHALGRDLPAGQLVRVLVDEAREAARKTAQRFA